MSYIETLGSEGIRLDLDIGPGDGLEERRLANIGEARDDKCAGVGVDGRETAQMLPNLLEVHEWVLEALANGRHATKRSPLQLLALEQRLSILQQAHVIARNSLDESFGS